MRTVHDDDEPLPKMYTKFEQFTSQDFASRTASGSSQVHVQPGAGRHESYFRHYWLFTAWAFAIYQCLVLGVVLANMVMGIQDYPWVAHLVSTLVAVTGIGGLAVIYRYILYPQPTYYSTAPLQQLPFDHQQGATA